MKIVTCLVILLFFPLTARPVQVAGGYQTTAPDNGAIAGWESGWGAGFTGWDYVGNVNGASAVYLGNGWVLSAAHVGLPNAAGLLLDGSVYYAAGPAHILVNPNDGSLSDVLLYQIAGVPQLPSLALGGTALPGSSVIMIGYGDGQSHTQKSWGESTVTAADTFQQDSGIPTWSWMFGADYGPSQVVGISGDSGGAGFGYNTALQQWELAGVMLDSANGATYFAALDVYGSQIHELINVPEPGSLLLLAVGFIGLATARHLLCRKQST